jgi:prepilin-type N-terminal cleavage/methylation domain-containing protein
MMCIPACRRGFTLIEVMISILILALGLLGLSAIVPVIVHEQRRASEQTLGIAAANAAQTFLQTRIDLDPRLDVTTGSTPSGWINWLERGPLNAGHNPGVWSPLPPWTNNAPGNHTNAYLWEALEDTRNNNLNLSTGDITLWRQRASAGPPAPPAVIRMQDRLFPSPSMQPDAAQGDRHRPIFVWDFVARRLPGSARANQWPSPEPQQFQVAIFVRRIDPGIRVASGSSLFTVLGCGPSLPSALAVAVDSNGRITNRGLNESGTMLNAYSPPVLLRARFTPPPTGTRNRIEVPNATAIQFAQLSQPGQRLVDNLGNIYTVQGRVDGPGQFVVVTPPIPASVTDDQTVVNGLRQVAYTPQVPAAVKVFTISRPAR